MSNSRLSDYKENLSPGLNILIARREEATESFHETVGNWGGHGRYKAK